MAKTVLPGRAWGFNSQSKPHPSERLWSVSNPQGYEDKNGGHWEFQVRYANSDANSVLKISNSPMPIETPPPTCAAQKKICTWKFSIASKDIIKWSDRMDLSFEDDLDDLWQLLNIKSQISPYVTVMSSDFSFWSGNNLTSVFTSPTGKNVDTGLLIGNTLVPIERPTLTNCKVTDTKNFPKDPGGVMYLHALNQDFPLLQRNL